MRWLRRRCRSHGKSEDVIERAHAENRLRSIEQRAARASLTILARNDHNHWTETIRQTIREGRA